MGPAGTASAALLPLTAGDSGSVTPYDQCIPGGGVGCSYNVTVSPAASCSTISTVAAPATDRRTATMVAPGMRMAELPRTAAALSSVNGSGINCGGVTRN